MLALQAFQQFHLSFAGAAVATVLRLTHYRLHCRLPMIQPFQSTQACENRIHGWIDVGGEHLYENGVIECMWMLLEPFDQPYLPTGLIREHQY